MLLKRFRERSLDAALRAVTSEFGDDAVLVETKRTRDGYEVLAAPKTERAVLQQAHRRVRRTNSADAKPRVKDPAGRGDAPVRWKPGFASFANNALAAGWSPRILSAVHKALERTQVHLDRPGDPAVPGIATRILAALIKTHSLEQPETRTLAFVGPTGVGKTTTLAKFAARAIRDRDESVGIVTLDTYRIAAVEQLRAFADMLACPFEVAFTPSDLRRAVARMLDTDGMALDRVFIDTTGRSPHDDSALQDLGQVLRGCEASTALCLPAQTRREDARTILDSWSLPKRPTAVVVTKDDETLVNGEVLSTLVEDGIPLSHITFGQRVPEDIVAAISERIATSALGEARHIHAASPHPTRQTVPLDAPTTGTRIATDA